MAVRQNGGYRIVAAIKNNLGGMMFNLISEPVICSPSSGGADFFGGIFPMLVIFMIFYIFLILPQQKKAKEHQKLLNSLKRHDRVLTSGGIYGTVINVRGDIVDVKIAENVQVEVLKSAISSVIRQETVTPEVVK